MSSSTGNFRANNLVSYSSECHPDPVQISNVQKFLKRNLKKSMSKCVNRHEMKSVHDDHESSVKQAKAEQHPVVS